MAISTWRLLAVAAVVRAAYLGIVLLLDQALDDYDTTTNLLSESCNDSWPEFVARQHGQQQRWHSLVVWDSVFLQRIAACGYEFEQYFAFFPGLPGLVRLVRSAGIMPASPLGFTAVTLVINNLLFLLSVVLLARLSEQLLQDDRVAATAVLVFIASPASIHHSMLYTEALFTASSWLGLYLLHCRRSSLGAALAFAAAAATRSNGLLNAGFILHEHGRRFLAACFKQRKAAALWQLASGAVCAAVAVAPYAVYTAFGYKMFCTGVYGGDRARPWCSKALPSAYGYVQDAYWDVGLFRYYQLPQIPNFLLASPTLIMSIWGALAYACACRHHLVTGGLLPQKQLARWFSRQPPPPAGGSGRSCGGSGSSGGSCLRRLNSSGGLHRAGSGDGGSGLLLLPGLPRPGSAGGGGGGGGSSLSRLGSSGGLAAAAADGSSGSLVRAGSGAGLPRAGAGAGSGHLARAGSGSAALARAGSGGADGSSGAAAAAAVSRSSRSPDCQVQPHSCRSRSSSREAAGRDGDSRPGRSPCLALSAVAVGHGSYCGWAVCRAAIPGVAFESLRQRQQGVQAAKQLRLEQQQQVAAAGARGAGATLRKRSPYEVLFGDRHQQQLLQPPPVVQLQQARHSRSNSASSDPGGSGSDDLADVPCSCGVGRCFYSPRVAVFVLHWAFLTAVCLAVVHIQVATRFLSSCVPLYWFAALLMLHKGPVLRWLLWWYCFAFMGVGAVFFINFYPWT